MPTIEQAALNAAHAQRGLRQTIERELQSTSLAGATGALLEALDAGAEAIAELCDSLAGERRILREREELLRAGQQPGLTFGESVRDAFEGGEGS